MLDFISVLLGALIGAGSTLFACRRSAVSQEHSDRINHLSHALSDYLAAFCAYQQEPTEPKMFVLMSAAERVRIFCSPRMLPVIDSFRTKILDTTTPPEELGRAYRAVADLARDEVHRRHRCRNR